MTLSLFHFPQSMTVALSMQKQIRSSPPAAIDMQFAREAVTFHERIAKKFNSEQGQEEHGGQQQQVEGQDERLLTQQRQDSEAGQAQKTLGLMLLEMMGKFPPRDDSEARTKYSAVAKHLSRAKHLDPTDLRTTVSLCRALLGLATSTAAVAAAAGVGAGVEEEAMELARELCTEGPQLNGHDYYARFYHASFLVEAGRIKKAAREFKEAAAIVPTEANAHFLQGRMLQILAARASVKAVKAKGGGGGSGDGDGGGSSEFVLIRKAVKAFKRALLLRPADPGVAHHLQLGLAALAAGV
jgi:tetratricopeptide (TPR) repeat protein